MSTEQTMDSSPKDAQKPCGKPACPQDECCESSDCQNLPSFREIAKIKEYRRG